MLDNFICSQPFFFKIKYYKVSNLGMRSNLKAFLTTIDTSIIDGYSQ